MGAATLMPIAVLSATRARRPAFWARMRSTCAFARSTPTRVTSNFGHVPTSKNPLALRRLSWARSTACSFFRLLKGNDRYQISPVEVAGRDQATVSSVRFARTAAERYDLSTENKLAGVPRFPVAETAAVRGSRSTRATRNLGVPPRPWA